MLCMHTGESFALSAHPESSHRWIISVGICWFRLTAPSFLRWLSHSCFSAAFAVGRSVEGESSSLAIARAGSETPAHPFASSIVNVPVRTRCSVAALDGPLKGLLPVSSRWSITPADQTSVVGVYDPSSISGDA